MNLNIKYDEYRLSNGMRVILHKDKSTPIVSVNVWYHVGSWNERPGKTGFAHLFEHMMFQGSQNVGSDMHFRLLQSIGGSVNGSTSFNRTNYYETVPSHYLELALWLEADRMGFLLPAMTQAKLDNQIDVVKNERRQTVDNQPYGTWLEKILETAYPADCSYHWPIIGYMDDIDNASLQDVSEFFKTYYSPANASLCIAGDFDDVEAKEYVEKYFGPIAGVKSIPAVKNTFSGQFSGEKRENVKDNIQLPRIHMAYHIPAFGEKDWYTADFLSDLLSTGKSSRLYHSLVYKQQLAQDAYAFTFGTEGTALMVFVATAQNGVPIEKLEKAMQKEIDEVIVGHVENSEIERINNQIDAQKLRELQSISHIADSLNVAAVHFDDPGYINRELDIYGAITKEELLNMAQKYLTENNRVVLNYLPK
ncbi:MAG: insulinase family protein [Calditrichaeota bacterium]|nr:MAG: insulinase family protein [Calditrichota bacterium]MBL1206536.1 insulinase family protein [Calditrichota bacterium]NOG46363.1 insulinase family protein [Calditrichota bacterium]